MLLFTGYNGYQQLSALSSNKAELLNEDVILEFREINTISRSALLSASWSNILVIDNGSIIISGFLNDKPGQFISLAAPFKECVVQCTCRKEDYFFVTELGHVWQYNIAASSWKDITNVFRTEVISDTEFSKIIKVSCGETLMAAISSSGHVFCMQNPFNEISGIKDVACGREHGILLAESGSVLTWGGGTRGQLGNGDLENSESPGEVEALSGLRVVKIAAGGWHCAAVTDQGDLYTWGWNKQGQLGFPASADLEGGVFVLAVPRVVELEEDAFVEDVSCGASHTVIKLRDGSVLGCGWNKWGQLSLKDVKHYDIMTLLPVPLGVSVERVQCAPWSTFIIAS